MFVSASNVRAEIERLELKSRAIEELNTRLVTELRAAEDYDKRRGHSSGLARKHFTLDALERNKEELERVQTLAREKRRSIDRRLVRRAPPPSTRSTSVLFLADGLLLLLLLCRL